MIDDSSVHDHSTDPRRNWAHLQEKMRDAIRAELDKINPTDDARRALELIIESSVRPSEVDGEMKLTIIDQDGKPRMIEKDGQQRDFTLQDLLEELRARYGVLFRSAKPSATLSRTEEPPQKREKPQRDWLTLDGGPPKAEADAPQPAEPAPLQQPQGGKLRIHEWSRSALGTWTSSVASKLGPKAEPAGQAAAPQAAPMAAPMAAEPERAVLGETRTRSWARPGLVVGAVAVLALLGVGAFLFRDDRSVPPQTGAAAPAHAGAAPSGPIREPEPLATGSTGSASSLRGVPDVIDTATLSLNGEVVRLFGVEWAPGAGKPEDLTQYLQGREVACTSAGRDDVYRCQVGGQDLSRVVLFNGGGKPTDDATPDLKAAADKAREAKIGVWGKQP